MAYSLSFNPNLHYKPKILLPQRHTPIHIQNSLAILRTVRPKKLRASLEPTSNLPFIGCSSTAHREFSRFFVEKIVTLFLGSFIFMGCLTARPVMAKPVQERSFVDIGVQQRESQKVKYEEDEQMCVKLLEENPKNVEALKMIVNMKMKNRKTKEAVGYVERLIEVEPDEVEWKLLEALCYEMMGQLSKAKRLFKDILKFRPLLLRALHGLAMVMHKNHEGPAVFDMLYNALEIASLEERVVEERNIKILIAQMHLVKGELEEALKKFQGLIDENPRDFRPYLCQGIIYSLQDRKTEADERFEIYRSLVPQEFPQRGFVDDVVFAAKTEKKGRGMKRNHRA